MVLEAVVAKTSIVGLGGELVEGHPPERIEAIVGGNNYYAVLGRKVRTVVSSILIVAPRNPSTSCAK